METIYQMNSISELTRIQIDHVKIRWLKMPEDYEAFCEHLKEQYPNRKFKLDDFLKWEQLGTRYCGLFKNGKIIARAAVEKYQNDKWETADVRVSRLERKKGYAKMVCYFVTKYILKKNKIATCRTEDQNIPMQHVIIALGFKMV